MTTVIIDYLIPYVRLRIGDTDSTSYRYMDEWLVKALILSIQSLQRYWNNKYFITMKGVASRNPNAANYTVFLTPESDGVIEARDNDIIIIKACLIILGGNLENAAWDMASWRDNEISYNNNEGGRLRSDNIKRLVAEFDSLIKSPSKRLAWPQGYPLPGYLNNDYENKTEI